MAEAQLHKNHGKGGRVLCARRLSNLSEIDNAKVSRQEAGEEYLVA